MTEQEARELLAYRRQVQAAYEELTSRRLSEIDPEWRDHYPDMEAAERAYKWELAK